MYLTHIEPMLHSGPSGNIRKHYGFLVFRMPKNGTFVQNWCRSRFSKFCYCLLWKEFYKTLNLDETLAIHGFTQIELMFRFCTACSHTPWKQRKTIMFSHVSRRQKKKKKRVNSMVTSIIRCCHRKPALQNK